MKIKRIESVAGIQLDGGDPLHKMTRKWFLISLVHPVISVTCLALGSFLPSGGTLGAVSYVTAMLGFLINLPGVFLLQQLYTSSVSEPSWTKYLLFFTMIAVTWGIIILPICYWISRMGTRRRSERSTQANG